MQTGKVAKGHYAYEKHGSCTLFAAIEPLTGWRLAQVHTRRTKQEYTRFCQALAAELPAALKIRVVQDNLNTHDASAFYENLSADEARALTKRFEFYRLALKPENCRFPSRQWAPEGLLPPGQPYRLVTIPLFFKYQQLGYALFEANPREGSLYETIGEELGTALQGALLMKQGERRARQLQTAAEVSRAATSVLELDVLLQQVVALVQQRFDLYYVGLFLVSGEAGGA
ncbi:MAG: transposase [Anaerolineae bacterium]|nr:transposase [Anaerolineae bacterium]